MSVSFQPGSVGSDLYVRYAVEERIRQACASEMAREATDRSARRLTLPSLKLTRLASAVSMALRAPVLARPAIEG